MGADRRERDESLDRLFDRLDLLGDLDDIGTSGTVGTGAGLDVATDALDSASDLGDAIDDLL